MPSSAQVEADRKALKRLVNESGDDWQAVETDEQTPVDPHARHLELVRLLKSNLAAQAVIARTLLRHDEWLERVGAAWGVLKRLWPVLALIAARPELAPEWLQDLIAKALGVQ